MKILKRIALVMLIVVIIGSIGFVGWAKISRYPALPEAARVAAQATHSPEGWLIFKPVQPSGTGFIFYPGGAVDPAAYAPLMQALAGRGITAIIVPMPLDLAVFDSGRASAVVRAYPEVQRWAIGGHSLGGAMAGQFLKDNPMLVPNPIKGLVLWGARLTTSIDVSKLPLKVLELYGTRDGVAPAGVTDAERLVGLPATTTLTPIIDGNHAMFGDYGPQKGDNPAPVNLDAARQQIIDATAAFLENLK